MKMNGKKTRKQGNAQESRLIGCFFIGGFEPSSTITRDLAV
jgi:hypothetical protein